MSSKLTLEHPTLALLHQVHVDLRGDAITPIQDFIATVSGYQSIGDAYVVVYEDLPLGVIVLFPCRPGVAQCWFALTDNVNICKIAFFRMILKLRNHYWKEWNLHRLQADTQASYLTGNRFIKAMGFEYEGCMKKYSSDKQDYNLYAYTGA